MRLRGLFFLSVLLLTVGCVSPVWANSVEVSVTVPDLSNSPVPLAGMLSNCEQAGSSSAYCEAFGNDLVNGSHAISGLAQATAAFGSLNGTASVNSENLYNAPDARSTASFSDNVIVTGGTGPGTLISHYSLSAEGAVDVRPTSNGVEIFAPGSLSLSFSLVQGSTERNDLGVGDPNFGYGNSLGYRNSYDISSPLQFGSPLLLGAEIQMGALGYTFTDYFGASEGIAGTYGLSLDGYTVLDSAGNVIADARVTPLSSTPEPGAWGLMLIGLGLWGMWRLRRRFSLSLALVGLAAVTGAVPVFANSVFVSNSTLDESSEPGLVVEGTPVPYCQDSGTSSAGCGTSFYGFVASGDRTVQSSGNVSATAAFGALSGSFAEYGSSGYFLASFGDQVIVTGGSGAGTLVAHYALSATADSYADLTGNMKAAKFSFVQGSTTTGIVPSFTSFGYNPPLPNPPPAGCEPYGLCFSENFDVTSPVEFGTALPLGAESYLTSDGFAERPIGRGYGTAADSMLQLTGYTVLDASGNVIGDAAVTQQHVPGLDLFPTPEPGTWGLMLMGLAGFGGWRLRRRRG